MAEKLSTVNQLKMLALRSKADSAAQISELSALVAAGLEDAQHTGVTVTLPAANWSGRAQTVQDPSLLADNNYWYFSCPDTACFMEASEAGVKADNIKENGKVTFRCEITPEVDLTVHILRLEVETT